jgi:hypothetical protein
MKIIKKTSLEEAKTLAGEYGYLIYGAQSCWWAVGPPRYKSPITGIPVDPIGGVLFETNDPMGFIEAAEKAPDHYGENGLDAFVAAYHGNLVTDRGIPTAFRSWDKYNDILNKQKGK